MTHSPVSPAPTGPSASADSGHLADHVIRFARVLRGAGLPVGPDRVVDALRALEVAGVRRRDDFRAALAAVLVDRHEQFALFDQAFDAFWRDPRRLEHGIALLAPGVLEPADAARPAPALADRLRALSPARLRAGVDRPVPPRDSEPGVALVPSDHERLRRKDFDSMRPDELVQAQRLLATLRLPIDAQRTRRLRPDPRGARVDLRDSLRASMRQGPDALVLRRRSPQRRPPPLVILCDISGSMARYSRMLLHFVHAITSDRERVHTFVFGTRLTNITRHLRHRDVDVALGAATRVATDWSGGTRIGATLAQFNRQWSRRVLGQNAVVLLITDGLDRDAGRDLGAAMERLRKSCRRLLWLNPLLRFDAFQPVAAGMRAMLPHVDAFLPAHDIASLADLGRALAGVATPVPARTLARAALPTLDVHPRFRSRPR